MMAVVSAALITTHHVVPNVAKKEEPLREEHCWRQSLREESCRRQSCPEVDKVQGQDALVFDEEAHALDLEFDGLV